MRSVHRVPRHPQRSRRDQRRVPLSRHRAAAPEPGDRRRGRALRPGQAVQFPVYGDEIKDNLSTLPEGLGGELARFLTEFCFGDLYTRTGLDLRQRELLVLCVLAALGGTDAQLWSHALGNVKVGNSKNRQITALIHCFPFIGFPRALNAMRVVNGTA